MASDVDAELKRADLLTDIGRWDEAKAALARVLAARPDSARAWCLLAYCHQHRGEYGPMLDTARRALAADPDYEWAHRQLSYALLQTGDAPGALRAAEEAVRVDPDGWRAHHSLTVALRGSGAYERALRAVGRALELAPDEVDLRILRARTLQDLGRLDEAAAAYRSILADDPDNDSAHQALGMMELTQGRPLRALRAIGEASRVDPGGYWNSTRLVLAALRWSVLSVLVAGHLALGLLVGTGTDRHATWPWRALTGTLALAGAGWLVARTLRAMPAGLRRYVYRTAPRWGSVWFGLALALAAAAQAYLPAALYPLSLGGQAVGVIWLLVFAVVGLRWVLLALRRRVRRRVTGAEPVLQFVSFDTLRRAPERLAKVAVTLGVLLGLLVALAVGAHFLPAWVAGRLALIAVPALILGLLSGWLGRPRWPRS